MTTHAIAAIVATAAGLLGFTTPAAAQSTAQDNALRLLLSNGMKGSMEELQPQCEKAVGRPLAIQLRSERQPLGSGWTAVRHRGEHRRRAHRVGGHQ